MFMLCLLLRNSYWFFKAQVICDPPWSLPRSPPFYVPADWVSPRALSFPLSLTTKTRLCYFRIHSWVKTPFITRPFGKHLLSITYRAHRECFMFVSSPGTRAWDTQCAHNILIVHLKEELISQIILWILWIDISNYLCKFSKGEHTFWIPSTLASSYLIKRKPTNLSKLLKLESLLKTGWDKCLRRGLDQHMGIWQ